MSQFAGLVNLGSRVLEVLPKVGISSDAPTDRGAFLRLLHAAKRVPIHSRGAVGHSVERRTLLGVFISAFLDEVALLARGGLLRQYKSLNDDLRVVRGRLQVPRQAAVHGMRPDVISCRFDELSIDNPRNQVLRAAMAVVRPWIESVHAARRLTELSAAFDGAGLVRDAVALIDGLPPDRRALRYQAAIRWAELILRLLSPNLRSGGSAAPEMLFDMNRLFEAAIAANLKERVRPLGIDLAVQDTSHELEERDSHPAFKLKPDMVLRRNDSLAAIADTKWTAVAPGRSGRIEPEASHVYQMNAYASAFGCEDFYLIYPWNPSIDSAAPSVFHLKRRGGAPVRLNVVCVDVGSDDFPARHGSFYFLDGSV
ncbi:McrC family protein [Arenimonas sp.]|uniref:McrC family protein n=1 Tax=Arenimonas sp. TaxID=1872635 RepID=UPI0035B2A9A8